MSKNPRINLDDKPTIGMIEPAHNGATRSQYGHYYDNAGTYLFTVDDEHETAVSRGWVKKARDTPQEPVVEAKDNGGDAGSYADFDFEGWVDGTNKVAFFTVKAAILDVYKVPVQNKEQAIGVIKNPPDAA